MTQSQMWEDPPVPDGVDVRDTWRTPRDTFKLLDDRFRFVVDLCADEHNAKCDRYFGAEQDSLTVRWHEVDSGWLFCNPPFSRLAEFAAKADFERTLGAQVVMMMPGNKHEQSWFRKHVIGCAHEVICFDGRVNYVPPPGVKSSGSAFPSFAVVWDGRTAPNGTRMVTI